MRSKIALLLILISLTGAHVAQAQSRCPTIRVSSASPDPFSAVKIKAEVSGIDPTAKLTFKWSVTTGEITDGQGSDLITVDLKRSTEQVFTATVEVDGILTGCPNEGWEAFRVITGPVAIKRDEYGQISFADEKQRLLRFAKELWKYPKATADVLYYAERGAGLGRARWRARRAKRYLIKAGIRRTRIKIFHGGYSDDHTIELFIVR